MFMHKKTYVKVAISALIFVFSLGLVLPAQAFYMEVPQSLKVLQAPKKVQSGITLIQSTGDSGGNVAPISTGEAGSVGSGGTGAPGSGGTAEPGTGGQPMQQPQPQQTQNQQRVGQTIEGCAPGTTCEGDGQMKGQQGPSEEQQKQQQERQMKDMKRGVRQMESNIKQLERMFLNAEKKGTVIPQEVKDKLDKIKQIISALLTAATQEEMQNAGMEEIGYLMQDLDESRRTLIEDVQRVQDMKRNLKNMSQNLRMFEKQIAQLTKQGTAVPSDVSENLSKIKATIAAVDAAKTWDEMVNAGIEDLQDLMMNLDQSRQQLEMLARWPQTIKQIDRELKQFANTLKQSKTRVNGLLKKGIDLSSVYADFEAAVNKLKSVRDEAAAKMSSGDAEGAFDLLQNDFYGQTGDVWEYQRTIDMMGNLGRFTSEFKQGMAGAQQTINKLKRQKLDTGELQDLLEQNKVKGNEVLALLKVKPIDAEAIMAGMEDLWNMKQEFENMIAELTGQETAMPWEQGKEQFQQLSMPSAVQKMIPQKSVEQPPQKEMAPGTSNGGGTNYVAP